MAGQDAQIVISVPNSMEPPGVPVVLEEPIMVNLGHFASPTHEAVLAIVDEVYALLFEPKEQAHALWGRAGAVQEEAQGMNAK